MQALFPFILLIGAFCLGALPLTNWIFRLLRGKSLAALGTGNLSVSAAFYHGGKSVGILSTMAEALRGILVVAGAQALLPGNFWPPVALSALIAGRFVLGRAAGATNGLWGLLVWSPPVVFCMAAVGLPLLGLSRNRGLARNFALASLPVAAGWRFGDGWAALGAGWLAVLLAWILWRSPDDLAFAGRTLTLDDPLTVAMAGTKAANLHRLRRAGLPVPDGWVLRPEDPPDRLLERHHPSVHSPWIVRSSATDEDGGCSSAAGQYLSIADLESAEAFVEAVGQVRASHDTPSAQNYRRDRKIAAGTMAVLVQRQIRGVYSGVLFTRDPVDGRNVLTVEAVSGGADRVVGGQVTPERYTIERDGRLVARGIPTTVLAELRSLALAVEGCFGGTPQDIEWTWDGERLWILQARPITNLQPVWTRTIAAEVIPGVIRPLTWSINRPLTCGVWGEIFTLVLGKRARDIDFTETATLLDGWAYFNATLLEAIFLRMGLPPESLDFLYRGSRFSRPPIRSVLVNLPGLARLARAELRLDRDWQEIEHSRCAPLLSTLDGLAAAELSTEALLDRSAQIQTVLRVVTYFNILAPLGLALRRTLLRAREDWLPPTAEVAAVRELGELARVMAVTDPEAGIPYPLEDFLRRYGYLSEVGTDIAVPTWKEHPETVRDLLAALSRLPPPSGQLDQPRTVSERLRASLCVRRAKLRVRVAEVYDRLLAHLRWTFVALEGRWLSAGRLARAGDIFFLEAGEVHALAAGDVNTVGERIQERRAAYERQGDRRVPRIVYGNYLPPELEDSSEPFLAGRLKGIAASRGQATGIVRVLRSLTETASLPPGTVLVVPYTDAGWAPLLVQACAIVSEVGGRLSHGAIIAREYGLPAVMNLAGATERLQDGQRVRIDGGTGTVELLEADGEN